jgi:hypothetical protein
VREYTLTLPKELPLWEFESHWTFKSSEWDCRGQNPLHWRIINISGKLLKRRCLKWACMTHLDTWNTSYGQKKGWESNWQFDARPLKVVKRPDSLACRWRVTCTWKALDKGYNFGWDLVLITGLHTKLWGLKVAGVSTLVILGLPFGSLGTKSHLDEGLVERCRVYYMGEDGGFSRIRAVVSHVNLRPPLALHSTQSAPTMH